MIQLFSVLIIIVSILLIVIIMVQNPKGGGLSSTFGGGSTQLFGGVKKAGDLLDRSTWGLAITLCALALFMNLSIFSKSEREEGSAILDRATEAPAQQQQMPAGEPEPIDADDMMEIFEEEN
jgi:preprotein translocase subunit SecG